MQDERWTSDDSQYPQRPENIPDDYYWDPEEHAWYPPGEPILYDAEAIRAHIEAEWQQKREEYLRHQQSVGVNSGNDLPAARALDVPPSWRKSLRAGVKREHLPLFPDDDT